GEILGAPVEPHGGLCLAGLQRLARLRQQIGQVVHDCGISRGQAGNDRRRIGPGPRMSSYRDELTLARAAVQPVELNLFSIRTRAGTSRASRYPTLRIRS